MKKILTLVVLVVAVLAARKYLPGLLSDLKTGAGEKGVRSRVDGMLTAMAAGDEQTALCQWAQGRVNLPEGEIRAAYDPWYEFAQANGLRKGMSWSLDRVTMTGESSATVEVTVDGRRLELDVRDGQRIAARD